MQQIDLSILVTTYNHGSYVRQALESIFMQKTKYRYEVLIGDDASIDNTADIIYEYQQKYPEIITVILREKNAGDFGKTNSLELKSKTRGKYVIILEGDDFWISDDKIEKQLDFLENNLEYIAVAHNCIVVNQNSEANGEVYPECKDKIYTFEHFLNGILPGQTATLMYRNIFNMETVNKTFINKMPLDRHTVFTLLCFGKIYCIQECMSAYRHIVIGGSSYSANYSWNYTEFRERNKTMMQYSKLINNKDAIKYSELIQMKFIIGSRKYSKKSLRKIISELKEYHFGYIRYMEYFFRYIKRKILKR